MGNLQSFIVLLGLVSLGIQGEQVLISPQITNWGEWGTFENCSVGKFVKGFQLKSETWIGPALDDTSMNGLRFFCGDIVENQIIQSSEGSWGKWRNIYTCGDGYVIGFQLKVERGSAIDGDETATNNIRIFCSNRAAEEFIEGDGERWGKWSEERVCTSNEAICGLQTQVQPNRGILLDDTALNNIAVKCCDRPACRKNNA